METDFDSWFEKWRQWHPSAGEAEAHEEYVFQRREAQRLEDWKAEKRREGAIVRTPGERLL